MVEEDFHQASELWTELAKELSYDEEANTETALKKCCSKLNLPPNVSISNLPIYKWAQQIIDTDVSELMQAAYCQKFCHYFLSKPK